MKFSILSTFLVLFLMGCAHTATDAPFCTKPLPKFLAKYDCDYQKAEKKKLKQKKNDAEAAEKERLKQLEIERQEEEEEQSVNDFYRNFYSESGAHNVEKVADFNDHDPSWDWSREDRIDDEEEEEDEYYRQEHLKKENYNEINELDAYRQSIRDLINERSQ